MSLGSGSPDETNGTATRDASVETQPSIGSADVTTSRGLAVSGESDQKVIT